MKKIIATLLCFMICASFLPLSNLLSKNNTTTTKAASQTVDSTTESQNYSASSQANLINLYVGLYYHEIGDEIDLVISTSLSDDIVDISFSGDGFALAQEFEIINNEIHFSVTHISEFIEPDCKIYITLSNEQILSCGLYGIVKEEMLFVDAHARFLAERAYQYYISNNKSKWQNPELNVNDLIEINNENTTETTSSNSPDTTITGRILWTDNNGNNQPLRFCRIKINRIDNLIDTVIYEGYTDENGNYYAEFKNSASDGLVDISLQIFAQGTDIQVCDKWLFAYSDTIDGTEKPEFNNISSGSYTVTDYVYTRQSKENITDESVIDAIDESNIFIEALQISQAAICASTYYEDMKGDDIVDVGIKYPHDLNTPVSSYIKPLNTICIYREENPDSVSLPAYASWDLIAHEYGHHVCYHEDLMDYTPGNHDGSDMAEHYKNHFSNNNFSSCNINCAISNNTSAFAEIKCKYEGSAIAWGEGYPTFWGELAQQYFNTYYAQNTLSSIPTVSDSRYRDYNNSNYSLESSSGFPNASGENNEIAVQRILYDLYDSYRSEEPLDRISLQHQTIWNYTKESQAKTLFEFIEYLKNIGLAKSQNTYLGEVLAMHTLTSAPPIIASLSDNAKIVSFTWNEPNTNGHYCARKFQVNFYDDLYSVIGRTTPQVVTIDSSGIGTISIDDQLWQSLINSDSWFYVSITVYECDGNTNNSGNDYFITSYESAYTLYFSPNHIHSYTHSYERYNALKHRAYCICGSSTLLSHNFKIELLKSTCKNCGYVTNGPTLVEKESISNPTIDNLIYIPYNEKKE